MKIRILAATLVLSTFAAIIYFSSSNNPSFAKPVKVSVMPDSINWDKMEFDAKKGYMKQFVMPQMKVLFRNFDSVKYGNINCKTCHGDGVAAGTYKMPNPRLPKLPNSKEGWDKIKEKHADIMKFMVSQVKPNMANLLGLKPFSKDNPKGFGCGNCHTDEE